MSFRDVPGWLRDTLLRLFPHATEQGLRRIGDPGPDSPVLLTGNFALTVRRLERTLAGRDAWLLVANSGGINVWCGAGGGHLTDHDVIAVIRASRIGELVAHRDLVLPQLAATGVQRRRVGEATGWRARWGPARLEDLPGFLDRGGRVTRSQRLMRFPLWERLEMSLMWAPPMTLATAAVLGLLRSWRIGLVAAAVVMLVVSAIFALLPRLRVVGHGRWLTYGGFVAAGVAAGAGLMALQEPLTGGDLVVLGAACVTAMLVLSIDLAGTTPWFPSTINTFHNRYSIELLEESCTGTAECVQVCPRAVLSMDGGRRKVEIGRAESCIRCGACIVQCPSDALRFRFDDGRVVEPDTVRRTRLNMLGRRTVQL
jgi:NAD-dependent dihydropyrimidine dehydrogenase PreA subunit